MEFVKFSGRAERDAQISVSKNTQKGFDVVFFYTVGPHIPWGNNVCCIQNS